MIDLLESKHTKNKTYFKVIPYIVYEIKTCNNIQSIDDFKKLLKPEFNIADLLLNECNLHNNLRPSEIGDIFMSTHMNKIKMLLN